MQKLFIRTFISEDDRIDHSVTEMVHVVSFGPSSVDINLYYFTKTTDWVLWRDIVEEHMIAFMKIVEDAGSSFAFPSQSIYVEELKQAKMGNLTQTNQIAEGKL